MPDRRSIPHMRFSAPAEHYDRFMGRYSSSLAAVLADAADVQVGQRALDVGCGPGALTNELSGRLGAEKVAAIEPSPLFAAACRERNPGVDVREGVAEQLPWGDDTFDVEFPRQPSEGEIFSASGARSAQWGRRWPAR